MMWRKFFIFNCLCLVASMMGCATHKVNTELPPDKNKTIGQWEAKLIVEDLRQDKTHSLNLDVIAENPTRMRMEITGTLGVNVASVVVLNDLVKYSLHTQKKYLEGPTSDKSFMTFLKGSLDPRWFFAIFFDQPIPDKSWICKTNAQTQLIESCLRLADKILIRWYERLGELKKVEITGADFKVNIEVTDFKTNVQNLDKAFQLKIPESYKRYKIP